MAIPFSYSVRNLWTRRLTTVLTVSGMALVVFVFAAILMLAEGLERTLVATGSEDNVIVIRKGSTSEVMSGLEREKAAIIETLPEVASGPDGRKLAAKEIVVLISLPKRTTGKISNVTIRGIGPSSRSLRPQVRAVEGRLPRPGAAEIMVGASIARQFSGTGLDETLRFGARQWKVVGTFDAGTSGFSSEIWADAEQLMQTFRRQSFSSVLFRLRDRSEFHAVRKTLENDPRLILEAKPETRYYEEQSEMMAKFLRILGYSLTAIFSIGAVIGAMITMHSAVAHRTTEIGTLRALGFRRRGILAAFLLEALLMGLLSGFAGLGLASFMTLVSISTMNFQSFAELAFRFSMSPGIVIGSVAFSLLMGLLGGLVPAVRASRMGITDALRAS
ncbi:MAG: ABC transporter permease [bacterium]